MKKIIILFFGLFVLSINNLNLKAECESDKKIVDKIIVQTDAVYEDSATLLFTIYGINKDMYIDFYNDFNSDTVRYTMENLEVEEGGAFFWSLPNVDRDVNYTVTFYSNSCGDERIKTIGDKISKVNKYRFSKYCKDNLYKSDLCDIDADTSEMSESEFKSKLKKEVKSFDTKVKIKLTIKKYYLFVLIPILVIAIIFVVRIILLKKREKEKLS